MKSDNATDPLNRLFSLDNNENINRPSMGVVSFDQFLIQQEQAELACDDGKRSNSEDRRLSIERNLPLVVEIAGDYKGRGLSFDDIVQQGTLALIHAVDGYRDQGGDHFGAYAGTWIRRAMQRVVSRSKTVHLSIRAQVMYCKVATYLTQCKEHGEEPNSDRLREIAFGQTHCSTTTQRANQDLALDTLQRWHQHRTTRYILEDHGVNNIVARNDIEALSTNLELQEVHDVIFATIEALDAPTRDREILKYRLGLYSGEPWSRKDTGREFGISSERVRQIEVEYLGEVRNFVADKLGIDIKVANP